MMDDDDEDLGRMTVVLYTVGAACVGIGLGLLAAWLLEKWWAG